ncbi:MAG: hypothetical protein IPM82_12110 [Saprospiraceae bacterium]|nr:hypothetical protein [Saprospiraceae bacterium]
MNPDKHTQWLEANQQYLDAYINVVRQELEAYLSKSGMEMKINEPQGFWKKTWKN